MYRSPLLAAVAATTLVVSIPVTSDAQQQRLYRPVGGLQSVRQMHGAVVLGDFLYVLGGEVNGDPDIFTPTVEFAPIGPGGALGAFRFNRPMPTPRVYVSDSAVAVNDVVYVAGGSNGSGTERHNTVIWASPGPDGILSPWKESPPFRGEGLNCFPAVATPGYLHIIGGLANGRAVSRDVQSGRLNTDGSLFFWEDSPSLPKPLYFHNAAALDGHVWVWGGVANQYSTTGNVNNTVYKAPIMANGLIGEWEEMPKTMPRGFFTATTATAGPYLISFCARYEGESDSSADIWFTEVRGGEMDVWKHITTDIPARKYVTAAPDYRRGNVYLPGGRIRTGGGKENVTNVVYMFTFGTGSQAQAAAADTTTDSVESVAQGSGTNELTYVRHSLLPSEALPGFKPYFEARQEAVAGQSKKPLVVYFTSGTAKPCQAQNEALTKGNYTQLLERAAFAWVEAREWPQMTKQLGVYRLPTWIIYNSDGTELVRAQQPVLPEHLASALGGAR